jgi:hypothetical protein
MKTNENSAPKSHTRKLSPITTFVFQDHPNISEVSNSETCQTYFFPVIKWQVIKSCLLSQVDLAHFLTAEALHHIKQNKASQDSQNPKDPKDPKNISIQDITCFLTHRSIWQYMIDKKIQEAAIFEDETLNPTECDEIYEAYRQVDKEVDLFVFSENAQGRDTHIKESFQGHLRYILNIQAARKLLSKCFPINSKVSTYLRSRSSEINTLFSLIPTTKHKEVLIDKEHCLSSTNLFTVPNLQTSPFAIARVLFLSLLVVGVFFLYQTNFTNSKNVLQKTTPINKVKTHPKKKDLGTTNDTQQHMDDIFSPLWGE